MTKLKLVQQSLKEGHAKMFEFRHGYCVRHYYNRRGGDFRATYRLCIVFALHYPGQNIAWYFLSVCDVLNNNLSSRPFQFLT